MSGYWCLALCVGDRFTFHVLHDHAQVTPCFKGAIHADHKGILRESQDVALHEGLLDLVPKDEVLLVDLLHGKPLPGFFMPNKVDCPEMERRHWVRRKKEGKDAEGYTHQISTVLFAFVTASAKALQLCL